ncbi:disulfide bond formation protein DsbA [Campylobacter pinnipediorum]|uniref:Disulfide bond formation protein DsbA n=1 Tax=Campylobacter pinnipediorum subsp. pinnipediorum TaxID=1660067 RepID=A0AAX0LBW6_9BACT|nr:disulfide bond formation protein DsbA [Campylobacter pinnipediorum]AQW83182.1 exopolyphosphatase, Ppx/GppA family [Campylobacter pinnipediorum subsp. pinnipediorum]AQW84750.1 exopolyphosphatase, Ppx/GppA family [Campylobacter pinnipediorum subsp. pinnipediorum]OPA81783.1 disulfide bond formation protein DsbA [Campylobacter pinnipediorum subsp. pinnipediorum]
MIIGIDLGSNTLRIALIKHENGICVVEKSFEAIVGSARGLRENMLISDEAKERIFNALKLAKEEFDFSLFEHIAVATAAFRIAKNSDIIFKQIQELFCINFQIISGDSEARYINLGVKNALNRLQIPDKNYVCIDLGGASSEISDSNTFRSFKFGIITFFEEFKTIKDMNENVSSVVKQAKDFLSSFKKDFIVLTSGVATTMAALKLGIDYDDYDANLINGCSLDIQDFTDLKQMLIELCDDKADIVVGKNRKMLVVAGMILLKELLKDESAKIVTIDDGLREGIVVAYFKREFDKILKTKRG